MEINITRMQKREDVPNILASVDIVLNDQLVINNILITKEDEKLNVVFPFFKKYNKFYEPVVRFKNPKAKEEIDKFILQTFNNDDDVHIQGNLEELNIGFVDINQHIGTVPGSKAFATVYLNKKSIIVDGIYIVENKEKSTLYAEFPKYKENGTEKPRVYFKEKLATQFSKSLPNSYGVVLLQKAGNELSENNYFKKMVNCYTMNNNIKVDEEIINEYKGLLPDDLLELWSVYGFSQYDKGFIKIINPNKYKTILSKLIIKDSEVKHYIPFLMTSFGELFYYRIFKNGEVDVSSYNINLNKIRVVEYGFDLFVKEYLCNFGNTQIIQEQVWSKQLVEKYGEIADDEIFLLDLPKANVIKNEGNNIDIEINAKKINIFDYIK